TQQCPVVKSDLTTARILESPGGLRPPRHRRQEQQQRHKQPRSDTPAFYPLRSHEMPVMVARGRRSSLRSHCFVGVHHVSLQPCPEKARATNPAPSSSASETGSMGLNWLASPRLLLV